MKNKKPMVLKEIIVSLSIKMSDVKVFDPSKNHICCARSQANFNIAITYGV